MKERMFEEFYFNEDNKIHKFREIKEYDENNNNIEYYNGRIFCPECFAARLIYCHSKNPFLKSINQKEHEKWCYHFLENASKENISEFVDYIKKDNNRIQSRLDAVLRLLNVNETNNVEEETTEEKIERNPFVMKVEQKEKRIYKTIRRKRLDGTWIDSTFGEELTIFFGRVKLKREVWKERNCNKLKIYTKNKKNEWKIKATILRWDIIDNFDESKEYNFVSIGNPHFYKNYLNIKLITTKAIKFKEIQNS